MTSSELTYSSFRPNKEASSHDSGKLAEPGYKSAVSLSEVDDKQEECKLLIHEVRVKTIGTFFYSMGNISGQSWTDKEEVSVYTQL
jgi:hypothetical protein